MSWISSEGLIAPFHARIEVFHKFKQSLVWPACLHGYRLNTCCISPQTSLFTLIKTTTTFGATLISSERFTWSDLAVCIDSVQHNHKCKQNSTGQKKKVCVCVYVLVCKACVKPTCSLNLYWRGWKWVYSWCITHKHAR